MKAPIFEICVADTSVQGLLGTPLRLYSFGEAEQDVKLPYAVWQVIYGSPENYLNQSPDVDGYGLQVDVYGPTDTSVRQVVDAMAAALELHAHIVGWNGETRDVLTRRWRSTFTIDFLVPR